jgi:hypothetical protein
MTIKLPITTELLTVASRVVWFKTPEETLSNPVHFLTYLMTYGTHKDLKIVNKYLTIKDFSEALENAPPGIMDPRSWAYWNVVCDKIPIPPMPKRFL